MRRACTAKLACNCAPVTALSGCCSSSKSVSGVCAGTLSKFGTQQRYDLRHSFPLLTSKRVFWKGESCMLLTAAPAVTVAQQCMINIPCHVAFAHALLDYSQAQCGYHRAASGAK